MERSAGSQQFILDKWQAEGFSMDVTAHGDQQGDEEAARQWRTPSERRVGRTGVNRMAESESVTWSQALANDDRSALAGKMREAFEANLDGLLGQGDRGDDYTLLGEKDKDLLWRDFAEHLDQRVQFISKGVD